MKQLTSTTESSLAVIESFLPVKAEPKCDRVAFADAHAAYARAFKNQIKGGVSDEDRDLLFHYVGEYTTHAVVEGIMTAIKVEKFPPNVATFLEHIGQAARRIEDEAEEARRKEEGRKRQIAWEAERSARMTRLAELRARVPLDGEQVLEGVKLATFDWLYGLVRAVERMPNGDVKVMLDGAMGYVGLRDPGRVASVDAAVREILGLDDKVGVWLRPALELAAVGLAEVAS